MKMKKNILTFLSTVLLISVVQSQEMTTHDVMRYNQTDINGTARYKGISGAMGAIGADLSALQINPAGGALSNFNTASFSMFYTNKNNKSKYLSNDESDKYSGLEIGQVGAVFVFNNSKKDATLKKFSVALNYQNSTNFNNNVSLFGTGQTNSLGDYFLQAANNNHIPFDYINSNQITQGYGQAGYYGGLSAQQAFLGYHSGLISPVTNQDGVYKANYSQADTFEQGRLIQSTGNRGYFSANLSGQLGERFYLGVNANLHTLDYTQSSVAYQGTTTQNQELIRFDNYLYTYGNGFSFQVGAIAKVTDNLNVGLAYESPTWYTLHDELSQGLATQFENNTINSIYPSFLNIYEKYKLKTPSKYSASLAYFISENFLISSDYILTDYSSNKFKPTSDPLYQQINTTISDVLKNTSEARIGMEYQIKRLTLRAGYRFVESPYKETKYLGDLNSYSLGIGYSFDASRLDLAYGYSNQHFKTSLVDMTLNNLYPVSDIKTKQNTINLTYTMYF